MHAAHTPASGAPQGVQRRSPLEDHVAEWMEGAASTQAPYSSRTQTGRSGPKDARPVQCVMITLMGVHTSREKAVKSGEQGRNRWSRAPAFTAQGSAIHAGHIPCCSALLLIFVSCQLLCVLVAGLQVQAVGKM